MLTKKKLKSSASILWSAQSPMEDRPSALAAPTYASESHTHPQCTQVAQNSEFCSEIGGLSVSSTKVCDDPCHQGGRILRDLWLLLWRTRDFSKCKVSLGVSGRLRCLPRHPSSLFSSTPLLTSHCCNNLN